MYTSELWGPFFNFSLYYCTYKFFFFLKTSQEENCKVAEKNCSLLLYVFSLCRALLTRFP